MWGVASISVVELILGRGETRTLAELLLPVSAMEVAVTVMLRLLETEVGALYVAVLEVAFVNVPQPDSTGPVVEQLQLTPLPLESFSAAAENLTVCPASMLVWPEGEMVTRILTGEAGGL